MKKLIFLVALAGVFCVYQLRQWVENSGPLTEVVNVVIPKGASVQLTARKLCDYGVIDKDWLFRLTARVQGLDKKLKAGEYQFGAGVSMQEVLDKLVNGDIYYRRLTLPEGLTTVQMLELVKDEEALDGELTLLPQEGELLPETYNFVKGDTKDSLVKQAMEAMKKAKAEAWQGREEGVPLRTAEEMMVLASIIEKETGVAEERGLVASVFVNRLKKGMRLQTDPTVIYALTQGQKDLGRALSRKDLQVDNPYNTYKYYGLPPAPICNPGLASIQAAVHPEASTYLYFVASGNGGHNFATSLVQHNQNVHNYRRSK